MNRRQEDPPKKLLEPFPSRATSVLKIPENWPTFSGSFRNLKTTFINDSQEDSTAATATESSSFSAEGGGCCSDMYISSSSVDTVTGETLMHHEIYPLHVASVINDDIAFRQLQSDLRNSGMVTSYGARYIMKPMVEKRAEEVIERQRQEELRIFQAQQEAKRRLREGNQQKHDLSNRRAVMKEKNKHLMSKSQRERWLTSAKTITSLAFLQPRSDTNEDIIMAKLPPVRQRASIGRAA
jgi:hypothetical protein